MATHPFLPPPLPHFALGPSHPASSLDVTEKKMDMSLEDIIKMSRRSSRPRTFNKSPSRNTKNQRSREPFQRPEFARSSALRQGKFAEARARNGGSKFYATQAAVRRTTSMPMSVRSSSGFKAWSRNPKQALARRRTVWGQNTPPAYKAAAGNMKISIINNSNKPSLAARRRVGKMGFRNMGFRRVNSWSSNSTKVDGDGEYPQPKRFRTLDALFARIREQRQFVQPLPAERNWKTGLPPFVGR